MRPEAVARIQQLAERRRRAIASLQDAPSGLAWCADHTALADSIVKILFEEAEAEFPNIPPIALVATGGYGRSELAPWSDIDLSLVPLDEASRELDLAVRKLFQDLHWAFGTECRVHIGYAFRLLSDSPGLDPKTRTGLMDARLVAGSTAVFQDLLDSLARTLPVGEFLLAKITERENAFARFHDTPLVVEPHLKEGAGGLRCFQVANWLRVAMGERPIRPTPAYDRILRVRNQLHAMAGKPQDNLTRSRQAELADAVGRDMYLFMSEVAADGVELHAAYHHARERLAESRFDLSRGVTAIRGEARIAPKADAGEASVGIAIATQLGLRVEEAAFAPCEGIDGPPALFAVARGEAVLRNLDRCGLLDRILPSLTRCRTLMPRDTAHSFTVFEHTLRVVRNLDRLPEGGFLSAIRDGLNDARPLYLAALLHDVGKAVEGVPHSVSGAEIASEVGREWGLAEETVRLVAWLVQEHLSMARFIRIRDVYNPSTVDEFVTQVPDLERLDMLTLLTYADISAVGEGAWTSAQETFLKELYERSAERLRGDEPSTPDPATYRQRLLKQLRGEAVSEEELRVFVESLPAHYLISTPDDLVRLHMRFVKQAREGRPTVELFQQAALGATDVTVCALDSPGLLSRVLGVLYAFDLTLIGLRAGTTSGESPVALDVFTVGFGDRPIPSATGRRLLVTLLAVIRGERSVEEVLIEHGKDPSQRQRLFKYVFRAGDPAVLEVSAPRGRGMAYRLSRVIAENGWNIQAARVGQWAGSGAGAFYLTASDGKPLPEEAVVRALGNLPLG